MLSQHEELMVMVMEACGIKPRQIAALGRLRERNRVQDLEMTPEVSRLRFLAHLWRSGRLSEWKR
jgi:hypothetical protein